MRSSIIAFLALCVVLSLADDLSVSTSFTTAYEQDASNIQTINIKNLLVGSNFSNSLQDVSFTVRAQGPGSFQASYYSGASAAVGAILAQASGRGIFSVLADQGTYSLSITVSYKKNGLGNAQHVTVSGLRFVVKNAGNGKNREVDESLPATDATEEAAFEKRQPGNNDVGIAPTSFNALTGQQTWNQFIIEAGSATLNSVSWVVYPSDNSVAIAYGATSVASITHNTSYTTSISFAGPDGAYSLNVTVRYKRGTASTFTTFWNNYPLSIGGASTSSARNAAGMKGQAELNVDQVNAQANGLQYVRADYALGAAVAGIALVAAVAVVGAMVVIRKKNVQTVIA